MKAKKAKDDMILFAVLLAAAVFFYFYVIPAQIHMTTLSSAEAFSPDTFPKFATVVFIVASVLGLIVSSLDYVKAVKVDGVPVKVKTKKTKRDVYAFFIPYIIFVLCIVYAIMFKSVGVIISTAIIPPIVMFCMGCRKWKSYAILYTFAAVLFVLFKFVLQVPLH